MKDTYQIEVTCKNCDYNGSIDVPKGTLASDAIVGRACPTCGCKDQIQRVRKQDPLDAYRRRKEDPSLPHWMIHDFENRPTLQKKDDSDILSA